MKKAYPVLILITILLNPTLASAQVNIADKFPLAKEFPNLGSLFTSLANFGLAVAGLLFFFMLLWGGIRYIGAHGDEKAVGAARGTLTTAFIGLLIVLGAFAIIQIIDTLAKGQLKVF
jgi:hypothetical protein